MRIASFILPLLDNDGASLATVHDTVKADLIQAFGGFTASMVQGGWRDEDTGVIYSDESVRYEVAADWAANARLERRFENLCARFCREARQLAVFAVLPYGEAVLLSPKDAAEREDAPPRVAGLDAYRTA